MDEPFGALDAQTRAQMQSYLLQIWKQVDITIVFITHDLDEAIYLADRILVLDAHPGRVREVMEVPVPRPRDARAISRRRRSSRRARHLEELIHPPRRRRSRPLPHDAHDASWETTSNEPDAGATTVESTPEPMLRETLRGGQAWSRAAARATSVLRLTDVEGRRLRVGAVLQRATTRSSATTCPTRSRRSTPRS